MTESLLVPGSEQYTFRQGSAPPEHSPALLIRTARFGLLLGDALRSPDFCRFLMASTSAKSCRLPEASLADMRSSRERKFAVVPVAWSITSSTRRSHAVSKSTPGIVERMSTATGSRPIRKNEPFSAKSAGVMPSSGDPNCVQSRVDRSRVVGVRLHQNVDILRRPWLCGDRNRAGSDDEILNAVCVQHGQEFFEVWVHPSPRPSWRSVPG